MTVSELVQKLYEECHPNATVYFEWLGDFNAHDREVHGFVVRGDDVFLRGDDWA